MNYEKKYIAMAGSKSHKRMTLYAHFVCNKLLLKIIFKKNSVDNFYNKIYIKLLNERKIFNIQYPTVNNMQISSPI